MENKALLESGNTVLDSMIELITDEDWNITVPTTPEWNVTELVNHVAQTNRMITNILRDEPPASEHVNLDDTDPVVNWRASLEDFHDALIDFTDYDKEVSAPGGKLPAKTFFKVMLGDRLAHSWDLAIAIGADDTLPENLVAAAYEIWAELGPHIPRGDGMAEIVDLPLDASTQDKFLALTGRDPIVVQ